MGYPNIADRLLPSALSLSEEVVLEEFAGRVNLAGSTVVEIGGAADHQWIAAHGVSSWHSVDPRNRPAQHSRRTDWKATAEHLPLAKRSIDCVFSCNAFQFVDIERVLSEAYRVLKPRGVLYAHFGPIWSGVDGHQLEYVSYRDHELLFCEDTLIPPYAHLRFTEEELVAILSTTLDPKLVELITHHTYRSRTINRLFYEDYLDLAVRTGFEVIEFMTSDYLDYSIDPPPYEHELLSRAYDLIDLGRRHGCAAHTRHCIGPRDIRMLLRKPA